MLRYELQMASTRVRLLLSDGHSCYRPRRTGERKRKSVRGCIVAQDLSVLALSVVKQGDEEIPGLTDVVQPKRLGPKRATKIRRFFGLDKKDDVRLVTQDAPIQNPRLTVPIASLSSEERLSQRARARNHTPRHQKFNASSLHNVFNTSVTESHSSADVPKLPRMLPTTMLNYCPSVFTRSVRREAS